MQGQNPRLKHYGIAVLAVALAIVLKLALEQFIGEESPFFLFFSAVIVATWYGGWKPGLFATILSVLAENYFTLTTLYKVEIDSIGQILRLILFLIEGILISCLITPWQAARQKAEFSKQEAQYNLELEKESEQELKTVITKLQESETRFRNIFESNTIGIVFADINGNITDGNDAFLRIIGYTRAEILAGKVSWRSITPPEYFSLDEWAIAQATKSGVCTPYEKEYICKDGSRVPILIGFSLYPSQFYGVGFVVDLTSRKQQENILRKSEEKYRNLIANLPGVVYRCFHTWDWRGMFISDAITEISGYQVSDFSERGTRTFYSIIHPEDLPTFQCTKEEAITSQQPFILEYRILHADGSIRWVYDKGQGVFNSSGEFAWIDGVIFDITQRKQAEEALKESEERLRLALEASQMGSWDWDLLTNTALCSEQHAKILGLPNGTSIHNDADFLNSIHPEDRQSVAEAMTNAIVHGADYHPEFRIIWPDGTVRWVISKGKVYCDRTGKPVRMLGVIMDITQRKQVEEEIYRSRREFKTLAENSPDIIFRYGKDCRYLYMSPAVERLIGIPRTNFIGKTPTEVGIPSDVAAIWLNNLQQVMTTGQELLAEDSLSDTNSTMWFQTRLMPEFAEDGSVESVMGIVRDITGLKQAEAALQQQAEQLAQANRLKDEFLAIVSHELRSPVSAILTASQVIRRKQADRLDLAQPLEIIERNGKLQLNLIEDLLDVSRIIRGQLRLNTSLVELVPIINNALEVVNPAAEAKAIQLNFLFSSTPSQVIGDADRLQQIVWNLLGNAVKFTPKGGRVQISVERINSHIEIEVSDTGKGIDTEFLPFVFDRFSQAASNNKKNNKGLGLGLAIVRHLVELHGGNVSVFSAGEGKGTSFLIELPVAAIALGQDNVGITKQKKEQQLIPSNPKTKELARSKPLQDLKLLVVDNNIDTCKVISALLEQFGAEVIVATSVNEAITQLEKSKPDVLLSDIGMPGESGYDLINKVKAIEAAQGIKIPAIALTGYGNGEAQKQAFSAGFQMFLTKPAEPKELANAIVTLAGRVNNA